MRYSNARDNEMSKDNRRHKMNEKKEETRRGGKAGKTKLVTREV